MNGVNGMNGVNDGSAVCQEPVEALAYHVLMNSRRYGTSRFACRSAAEAVRTLAWLAERAEAQQRLDGAQRFFCLLPPPLNGKETHARASMEPPADPTCEDAIVVCVGDGTLQWIAGENLDARPLLVLEAVGSPHDGSFVCWEAYARPFARLEPVWRQAIHRFLHLRGLREPDTNVREEREEGTGGGEALRLSDPLLAAWQRLVEETRAAQAGQREERREEERQGEERREERAEGGQETSEDGERQQAPQEAHV